jgi:hypothetical protein
LNDVALTNCSLLHRKEQACEHWRGGVVRKLQPAA